MESVNLLVSFTIYFTSHTNPNFTFNFLQVSTNGNVLHSEIVGCVKMKTKLSGMPELRLGLNDRVQFESTGRANGTIFPFSHFFIRIKF